MKKFSERLKELRYQKQYSQKKVAADLGMTFSALSQYENGKRTPKNEVLIQLAAYYNVSVDYLLGLIDNPVNNYMLSPSEKEIPIAASPNTYTYDIDSVSNDSKEIDLSFSKSKVLASINRLPASKQVEVLALIESLIAIASSN